MDFHNGQQQVNNNFQWQYAASLGAYSQSVSYPINFNKILNVIISTSGTSNYEGSGFDGGAAPTNRVCYVWSRYGTKARILSIGI